MCRVSRIEFIDDKEVSKRYWILLKMGKEKGMNGIHGPLGFTNLDHQAILIEGFDHLPSIASEYHLPYYKEHFEAAGYEKEMDWVEFRLKLEKEIPEKALKLNDMIQRRYNLKVFISIPGRDEGLCTTYIRIAECMPLATCSALWLWTKSFRSFISISTSAYSTLSS